MSKLRVLSALLLLFIVPVLHAQKRRSVRFTPPSAVTPGNDCHTFALVRPGLKAGYRTVAPGGTVTFQITYISDTPTQTKTTQQVQAPTGNADVETTLDGEIVGTLRALEHIELKTSTTVPILGKLTTEVDIDFVPSLAAGPAAGWCVGETWSIPPSTETIVTQSPQGSSTLVVTTVASTGEVLAVGETITVPAGSFRTVKYRNAIVGSGNSVQPAITWTSMDHSIVVKQDTLDANGAVTSVTELTSLQ